MNTINTSKLMKQLAQLEQVIPNAEKKNQLISNANVGWHIGHTLMVLNGIIETTSNSDPNDYKWSFNFKRVVVFTRNKIPRGVAKAPKSVNPKDDFTQESLSKLLSDAKVKLEELHTMDQRFFFKHPSLGNLKFKQMIQFLAIHTKHHLDIIHDILKSEK
jgi:hypothetical protein